MTGPRWRSRAMRDPQLAVLLLLLSAGLLCTGSHGFRVRETASSDVCQASSGRCTSPASASTPWANAGLRPRRGFEPVSTRGGFVKPPIEQDESLPDEQPLEEEKREERPATKWKDKKTRSWSKLAKLKDDEKKGRDEEAESDDELIQIEVEEDEEVVVIEDDDEEDESREKLERAEERRRKEEEERRRAREKEEQEQRRREEEEKRRREKEVEEMRKRKEQEEEERKRKEREAEEKRKREEAERRKKEEAERRLKEEAERRLKEAAEKQRREEEERKRREEAERRLKEAAEKQRREEEERKRKEEEERRRREEQEKERKRKEEEERRRKEEEEERVRREQEEEERRKKEAEEKRLREEEECRLAEEEERRLRELEERRVREEEERKRREAEAREAERKRKLEEERKRKELEAERKRKKKEEEERLRKEREEKEAERIRDAEEDRRRVERVKREAEEKRLREEEERRKRAKPKAKKESDEEDDEEEEDEDGDDEAVKRTVEKIRQADKEKAKSAEAKATPSKAKSKAEGPKAKPAEKNAKPADQKKPPPAAVTKTKTTSKPREAEALLTLAELNDLILSVPSFVPNFTAVEDTACQQHGKIFLRQLRAYKLWALQMLDSGAKIPSGLLRGNVNQLGDFDQCLGVAARVKVDSKTIRIQGKYCLASVDLYPSRPATKLPVNLVQSRALIRGSMRDPGHFVPKFTTANWAICLPAACSAEDARRSIENALDGYNATIGIKFAVQVHSDMCYVKSNSQSYSKETIGVLYFYAIFVCVAIVATMRDYLGKAQEKGNYSERIIMAFSLKRTLKALFGNKETSSSDIGCIHGIRALSSLALYVAHKLIPTSRMPYANRVSLTEVASHPLSLVLRASLFYTDSFLLMSGVLTAFNMAKELSTRGEIRWFSRLIARYMRLTPPLLAIVFWYAFVMEHTGSGPQWNAVVKTNADICKENAWTNLFYVQNFFPFEDMCATHTHQLALDMQLTLAAPALVFFLQIKPVVGIITVFFLLQVSATLRYLATSNNNLSLVIFHGMTVKHLYKTANLTYILPLHRATPYLFGVSLGVLLHYTGKRVRMNKIFASIGWVLALAIATWSIFSPWRLARRDYVYNVEDATHYAVVSPILTALSLSWVIFACFTENGGFVNRILSSYWMVVFSKLTYAIYLSQFIVFFYNVGTARYSSEFHPFRALDPIEGASVIVASVVLTLLFDIPMQEVKSIIMECSDMAVGESDKPKEPIEPNHNSAKGLPQEESFEEETEEEHPGNWNWDRGTFTRLARSEAKDGYAEPAFRSSRVKRQDVRRQSIIIPDGYDEWDSSRRTSRSEEPGQEDRWSTRSDYRLSGAGLEDELMEESYLRGREPVYSRGYSRSPMRDLDTPVLRRSVSRDRHVSAERELPPMREYSNKPLITISQDDDYQPSRSARSSVNRFSEPQRSLSSESELEPASSRRSSTSYSRRATSAEPRVVDEDEWEEDVRLRRGRLFQDHLLGGSQEREHPLPPPAIVEEEPDDEWDSLKRRSSAEGKMALLKEPIRPGNIALWTVSKIQLGSSQEPDDEDFEEDGTYKRQEYREQGPPPRDEMELDELAKEAKRRSFAGGSLPTSFEDEEDSPAYDFSLSRDSKRITVQDLSRLSSEEDQIPLDTSHLHQLDVKPALIKRESIIKSQASEEDPEYLIPERPKLVEQEQEHPFKKAWQMQKSRSEEEGAGFLVKDLRSASASLEKQDEEPEEEKHAEDEEERRGEGAQSQKIGTDDVSCDVTLVWQTRGLESNGGYDKSKSSSMSSGLEQQPKEEEEEDQIDGYRGRRKSDEEKCTWTEKDT